MQQDSLTHILSSMFRNVNTQIIPMNHIREVLLFLYKLKMLLMKKVFLCQVHLPIQDTYFFPLAHFMYKNTKMCPWTWKRCILMHYITFSVIFTRVYIFLVWHSHQLYSRIPFLILKKFPRFSICDVKPLEQSEKCN